MTSEDILEILRDFTEKQVFELPEQGKKVFYAIMDIADQRDELKEKLNIKNNYFQTIIDLGYDYDGYTNSKDLKELIDELVDLAKQGRKADK